MVVVFLLVEEVDVFWLVVEDVVVGLEEVVGL